MQNWLGDVAASVRAEGVIYSPIEDGRVPLIDGRDIAAVAFEALVNPDLDRAHMVLSSMLALIELARSILAERKDGGTPWHAHHMRAAARSPTGRLHLVAHEISRAKNASNRLR